MPYGSVAGHRVGDGHRVPYRPSPDTASRMVVAYRIARRRIACGRVRRGGWSSRAVGLVAGSRAVGPVAGSHPGVSLPVSATCMSLRCSRWGEPDARRRPCPGPTAPVADAAPAIYEHLFFCMAVAFNDGSVGGAAKACVGPLAAHNAVAGQTCQPDITGNN